MSELQKRLRSTDVDTVLGASDEAADALDAQAQEIERLTLIAAEHSLCGAVAHECRRLCKEIMGGNLAFIDDDFARCLLTLRDERDALRALVEAAERDAERLKRGLKFYAEGDHFQNDGAFDTVSGEPQNFWCDQEGSMVEDGTVAKKFLEGWDVDDDDNWIVPAIDAARGGT